MAFKLLSFAALLAAANAGIFSGYSSHDFDSYGAGYAHSYATPLAYSAGHYGGAHLSAYSSPLISKAISAAPLAYSAPLAHYSADLHHYNAPTVYSAHAHHLAAPLVAKTYVSTPVIKSYAPDVHAYAAPSLYSSHVSTPLISKSYGLGYSSYGYPSYGYASKYHF